MAIPSPYALVFFGGSRQALLPNKREAALEFGTQIGRLSGDLDTRQRIRDPASG